MIIPIKEGATALKTISKPSVYATTVSLAAIAMCVWLINTIITDSHKERDAFLAALSAETAAISKLSTDIEQLKADLSNHLSGGKR